MIRNLSSGYLQLPYLTIEVDDFHGDWNYTIPPQPGLPHPPTDPPLSKNRACAGEAQDTAVVTHPALTGLSRP